MVVTPMGQGGAMQVTIEDAARAVAAAMRPQQATDIERRHNYLSMEAFVLDAFRAAGPGTQADIWWRASGRNLTVALDHVTGCGEEAASFLLGAAVHVQIGAGRSIVADEVLRLAERATCWLAGERSVAYNARTPAHV